MNTGILAVILVLGLADLPKPLQKKIDDLYRTMFKADFKESSEALSGSERLQVISWMKDEVQRDGHEAAAANIDVLVNLGDEQTITQEARSFPVASHGGGSFLIDAIQPKVVSAIAPYLLNTEPSPYNKNGGFAKSFFTAETIREILERSPYFSTAVNRWAASWKGKGGKGANPPYEFREEMRKWWAANEVYIVSGNYAAVQPGDSPSTESTSATTPLSIPTPFPEAISASASSTPPVSSMPLPPKESGWSLIFILGAIALAVGGFLIFLKTRR